MRGNDEQQLDMFSYISPEERVPQDHPLRPLRVMTDEALQQLQPRFNKLYAKTGRPSIAPEKLLRALLLQALYSVRSERLLMEQLNYNLLFRWFVGLNMDDSVWDVTVFTKNRERLLDGDIAEAFFQAVLQEARERSLLSDEHFTVDGTLLEAWASVKSYQRKDEERRSAGRPWQCDGGLPRGEAVEPDACIEDGPGCEDGAQRQGQRSQAELQRESAGGEPPRSDRKHRSVRGQRNGGARCRAGKCGADYGYETGHCGRRQGIRHGGLCGRVPKPKGHAACGPEPGTAWWERD